MPRTKTIQTTAKRKPKPAAPGATKPRGSHVASHEYNPETEQLSVTFASGARYRYEGVAPDLATDFEKADSRGSFLHKHIIGTCDACKIDH